jgi:uncharacterized phage protein gp47/JayE
MADFPTFSELFAVARNEVLVRNPLLSVDAVDRPGTDSNAMIAAAAAAGDEVVAAYAQGQAGLFLDSAEGPALDRLVFDRYGLVRKPASVAKGTVSFSTATVNAAPFTIPAETLLSDGDGRQYITTAAALFPAGATGPIIVPIRSVLAGLDQQAADNVITSILGSISGAALDLSVTNTLATAGADNAENDSSLRERARRFFSTAQKGTLAALEQAALDVPGIRRATAIEVVDGIGRPARIVQLVVADAFVDALAATETVPASFPAQSQYLAQSVIDVLPGVRAAGIYVEVVVAQVVLVPISLQLRFFAGSDTNVVALLARAAIVGYINSLRPGDSLSLVALLNTLRNIRGLAFYGDEITAPVGDIVVHPLQVLRTTIELVATTALAVGSPQVQQTQGTRSVISPIAGTSIDASTISQIVAINNTTTSTALGALSKNALLASLARPLITQLTLAQLLSPNGQNALNRVGG